MSEKPAENGQKPENPFKTRPFFRRVLWRLFGEEGMFNTLPNSEKSANRLISKVEDAVAAKSISREGLQYLQMVHLHLVGDGLDQLLRAQEKTNRLLAEIRDQQASIGDQLEDVIQHLTGEEPEEERAAEVQAAEPEGAPQDSTPAEDDAEPPDEETEEQGGGQ